MIKSRKMLAVCAVAPSLALAAMKPAAADPLSSWFSQQTATGNWGGVRTDLQNAGVTPFLQTYTEYSANPIGGDRQGMAVAQLFEFGMDLDTKKIIGLPGGTLHFALNWQRGQSDTVNFIHNEIPVQDVYGDGQDLRLLMLSYEQKLYNNKIDAQFGYYSIGSYFGVTPMLCNFQSFAICIHPFSLLVDSGYGYDSFPTAQLGAHVTVNFTPSFYTSLGIANVDPKNAASQGGFNLSLHGSTGVMVPYEFGWTPTFGEANLPGHYKIGGYYDTYSAPDVGSPNIMQHGTYGAYVLVDQMLMNFGPDNSRGLIVFAQGTIGDKKTSLIPYSYDGGVMLDGPFAFRPHDTLAASFAVNPISNRLLKYQRVALRNMVTTDQSFQQGETDLQLVYGIQAAPWLKISPELEYIIDPGAFSYTKAKNAWVLSSTLSIKW